MSWHNRATKAPPGHDLMISVVGLAMGLVFAPIFILVAIVKAIASLLSAE